MVSTESESLIEEYERHSIALAELANTLNLPPEEAEELIHDVLLSTLIGRPSPDMDMWLAAAFTEAARGRGAGAS